MKPTPGNQPGVDTQAIINLLKNEGKPLNVRTVMHRLKLPRNYRATVKRILKDLYRDGAIVREKKSFSSHEVKKTVTGKVDIRNEYGFLAVKDGGDDIFIPPGDSEDLLPGDEIEVYTRKSRSGGIEGELKRIVKRTEAPLMCKVKILGKDMYAVLPFKKNPWIKIRKPLEQYHEGDLVLVNVEEKNRVIYGDVISHIYDKTDMKMYLQFILTRNEVRQVFPNRVIAEAQKISIDTSDLGSRTDLRDMTIITIDPKDAKDFDDAVSLEKKDGKYRLGVHIADVTHYMKEGSALDGEASLRGLSTYLPGSVIPMLPEELSNEICSLKGGVDRMCFSIFMELDTQGEILGYEIMESVINNKRRFTYEEVEEILEGGEFNDKKIKDMLLMMDSLKDILRSKFRGYGNIDFTLGEPVFVYGDNGEITDIIRKEAIESNKLIEYFMISANMCAADYILKNTKAGIFRVHEKPALKDIDEFNVFMRALGMDIRLKKGDNKEFQRVVEAVKDSEKRFLVEKKLLRAMRLARYSEKNTGHFGLGIDRYSHFTSPIRRYADVICHRLIKHFKGIEAMKDISKPYLKEVSEVICDLEDRAEKTENDVFRLYCLDFLKERVGDVFEGNISKITKNGMIVELNEYPVEGFVNFDIMMDDYYSFDAFRQVAVGKRTKMTYKTGGDIKVIITRIDLESLKLELEIEK